jgi:hypothetical protein
MLFLSGKTAFMTASPGTHIVPGKADELPAAEKKPPAASRSASLGFHARLDMVR